MTTPHPTKSAPAPAAVAPQYPPMPETWHVDVHVHGEKILSIGYDWLSGKGDLTESEEQAVVGMAQHLLSFVGYGLPQSGFDPDADEQAPAAQGDALDAERMRHSANGSRLVRVLYNESPGTLTNTEIGAWIQYAQQLLTTAAQAAPTTQAAPAPAAQPPALTGDLAEPRYDSDRIYDRPVGYLPAYELSRLHSGHGAQLRSAKFGPSALDGDVPVYLESSALALVQALIGAQRVINSMKVEAETAAQGDEQMMLDACEQISNEGLEASLAIQAALSTAAQPLYDGDERRHVICLCPECAQAKPAQPERVPPEMSPDFTNPAAWPLDHQSLTDAQLVVAIEAAGFKTWDSRMWELKRQIEAAHGIKPAKEQP